MLDTDNTSSFSYYKYTSGPVQISFDITQACNLKCVHCFNDSGDAPPLKDISYEKKLDIARQIAAVHPVNVCICGGETTCSPILFDVIDALEPENGARLVSMVSNGFLMTQELADKLKAHGVYLVQISVDGANAWQHDSFRGVDGSFDRAVNAIKYLKKAGLTVDTAFTPNVLNYRSFRECAKLLAEFGVYQMRVMPFLPSGRGVTTGSKLMLNEEQYFHFQRELLYVRKKYQGKMEVQWGDPLDHLRRMPANADEGLKTYVMEIKTNGDLTFTTYLPVKAGNLERHTIMEYWNAGYSDIWADKRVQSYAGQIRCIYDLEEFEPQPYTGEMIDLELIRD